MHNRNSQPLDESESLRQYAVRLSSGTQYILAANDEDAAWCALELSNKLGLRLYDVQLMSGKKGYFPNKWKKLKDIPASEFESISYEDVMEWKVAGWELNHDVACVIRATDIESHKVKEFVYKRTSAAENRIRELLKAKTHELVICSDEAVYYVHPEMLDEDDDE